MAHDELKRAAYEANIALKKAGLVLLTWGNASAIDRERGLVAIKPSGVEYETMHAEDMVVLSLETGRTLDGTLRPSSDTPTHLVLYRAFPKIGGIVHTHSTYATAWAQACRTIPCFGTTHADLFHGPVPLTRALNDAEVHQDYETATGNVIVERFSTTETHPLHAPGVLVAHHGPFAWGKTPSEAVESAIVMEEIARMAFLTVAINPKAPPIPQSLSNKHFERKHGPRAYYGQNKPS